ncbi:hypothetical protein ACFQ23_10255 [Schaalia naturae]|uniref:Uncharacterized protein n=1 Tax=Schaalia naturae TaxID=635203 RepID=A0ABW2SIZ5_9ACTO
MGTEAPQWLYRSFIDAMREIGATASDAELLTEARDLIGRWNEPIRHLHNIHHLINVLAHVDELSATAHDPDLLRVGAWYHGAVLNTAVEAAFAGSDADEIARRCAGFTSQRLSRLGVGREASERVAELIRDVALHVAPRDDVDAQVLVDADLATLACSPQEYKKYRQTLRQEYSDHDELAFLRARRRVVRHLLSRPALFQSPRGQAWESRARENLEAELAKTEETIAKLDPGDPEATTVERPDPDVEVVAGPTRSGQDPDEALTATGTLIIRRRHVLRKPGPGGSDTAAAPVTGDEAGASAGPDRDHEAPQRRLPDLRPDPAEERHPVEDEEDASSLETAIDALDVPSRPAER